MGQKGMKRHIVHFDPYYDPDSDGPTGCGVVMGQAADATGNWAKVTCRRCLKQRNKLDTCFRNAEEAICRELGMMADFLTAEEKTNGLCA